MNSAVPFDRHPSPPMHGSAHGGDFVIAIVPLVKTPDEDWTHEYDFDAVRECSISGVKCHKRGWFALCPRAIPLERM